MKAITIKSLSFIIGFLCAVTFGYGQNVISNNIDGVSPNFPNNSDPFTDGQIVNPNVVATGISKGPGITDVYIDDVFSAAGWDDVAIDDDYFEFVITPNAGYEIDFDSFEYNCEKTHVWLDSFAIRSSVDGFTSDIGKPIIGSNNIDLSSAEYQNISGAITFRIYAWGQPSGNGSFSINDFAFNVTVAAAPCSASTTWNGFNWSSPPTLSKIAIINNPYDTANGVKQVSFSACRLIVNSGVTLTIDDGDYVEIQNDITVNTGGTIIVRPQGAVVQIDDTGTVLNNGIITVDKETAPANYWYEYTYWSSPVRDETIALGLAESDASRRFWFDASKFLDATAEDQNNNAEEDGQDDIDDDNNDWQYAPASTIMTPGMGYASTHDEFLFNVSPGNQFIYTFEGPFNTGVIQVPLYRNDSEMNDINWNFIGNPYPSAISTDLFFDQNTYDFTLNPTGALEGAIYLWSQNTTPSSSANGNQNVNFSQSDYAIINRIGGVGNNTGGETVIPNDFVPSGQGFFVALSDDATVIDAPNNPDPDVKSTDVIFNNAMRVKGATDNSQFFRIKNKKPKVDNKVWLNLISDNGIFNQALIGYVNGATNNYDGMAYDAPRNLSTGTSAILYSNIEGADKKFAIQGKAEHSLNKDEIISIGFKTTITVATIYTLSIAQLEGDFLSNNAIYIKDNFLNVLYDLKASDYNFTSEVGEFNERFEIVFNSEALSIDSSEIKDKALSILELQNGDVQFKLSSNLKMKTIQILDLQGRLVYSFKINNNSQTYNLSNLSQTAYIAKVELNDGYVITKKMVKRR